MALSVYETNLLKKFEERIEFNRLEHKKPGLTFIFSLTWTAIVGLVLGGLVNFLVIKMQGPVDKTTISYSDCLIFVLVQIVLLSIISFLSIHINRHFDDWIWSSFTGMMFWLTIISSQSRFMTNISVLTDNG